jgi:WD40 repeat protein/tRNA A-37 threonylcarbamoyl transferase component Bud32
MKELEPLAPPLLKADEPTPTMSGSSNGGNVRTLEVAGRDRYLLKGVVAEGGHGRILQAEDLYLERLVALKELRKLGGFTEARFLREARITARLQHPAIVPVYEAGRWPSGEPFYAMKLVSGRSLAHLIGSLHTMSERLAALSHVLSVAEAMAYAHSQRIIHRDLKPANVLVGEFGETVVVDWGLAKDLDSAESVTSAHDTYPSTASETEHTEQGTVMGTPSYLPLEQASGAPVDERADVYAIGAILYHLLSGRPPYRGSSAQEILQQVLARSPVPLRILQPKLPEELLAIVSRAMARKPAYRYPSARELAEDLKRFLTGQLVGAHRYSAWHRVRRFARQYQAAVSVATIALVFLVMGGVVDYQRVRRERDRAEEKQAAAEKAEAEARQAERSMVKAKDDATQRADALTILEARNALANYPEQVFKLLNSLSPSFAEWGQVRTLAATARSQGESMRLKGHTRSVRDVQFSPDGRQLVTAGYDGRVFLWELQSRTGTVLEKHYDGARIAIFSPDGKYVASSSKYGPVKLREIATGTLRELTGHTMPVTSLVFLPDSRGVVSAGLDGQIRLWDVNSGSSSIVGSQPQGVKGLYILPSGRHVISIGVGDTAWIWDLADSSGQLLVRDSQLFTYAAVASRAGSFALGADQGRVYFWGAARDQKRTLDTGRGSVGFIALSPDGRWLVTTGGRVKLWDIRRGTSQDLNSDGLGKASTATFSPDGKWLAIGGGDGKTLLREIATGISRALPGNGHAVVAVAFSADSERLAVVGGDSIVRLHPVKAIRPHIVGRHSEEPTAGLLNERTHFIGLSDIKNYYADPVTAMAPTPGGSHVLSAGRRDNHVRLSGMENETSTKVKAHSGGMTAAYVHPQGSRLITAGGEGTIALWDESGRLLQRLSGAQQTVKVVTLTDQGTWVAAGDTAGGLWLWEVATGKGRNLGYHEKSILTLAFSPDGRYLASGGSEGELRLWEVATGVGHTIYRHRAEVVVVGFSPDGSHLATGSTDSSTWLHALNSGKGQLLDSGSVATLQFSRDGRQLFTAELSGTITRWQVETGMRLGSLLGHSAGVIDLALSPEGERLASASADGTLRLWDLRSGESRVLQGHEGSVTRVAFSQDGRHVLSADFRGTLRLWSDDLPLEPQALRAWIRETAER